jgi:hypothetical protein
MSELVDAVQKADLEPLLFIYNQGDRRRLLERDRITGNTLLHTLAEAFEPGSTYPVTEDRRMDVAKFLVEKAGVDIKIKNNYNETALDIANRKHGKQNLLSTYFGRREPALLSRFTVIEREAFKTHLFDSIRSGNMQAFTKELETIAGDFNVSELEDSEGNHLLMVAVKNQKMPFIRMLVADSRFAFNLGHINHTGQTVYDLVADLETENLLRQLEESKK